MSKNNSGARRNNLTKLFHVMSQEAGTIIWVQPLGNQLPKIWEGKKRPKFGAISGNFFLILIENISGTDRDIDTKRKTALSIVILPTFCERIK